MSKARDTLDALSLVNAPDDGKTYQRVYDNWQEAPVAGYALLDFGTVTNNNRYVLANPFGNDTPVICVAELFINSKWSSLSFVYFGSQASYGTRANMVEGEGVTVVTGSGGVSANSVNTGGSHQLTGAPTSAPCRVHVWRLAV